MFEKSEFNVTTPIDRPVWSLWQGNMLERTCSVEEKSVRLAGLEVETCAVTVTDYRVRFTRQVVGQIFIAVQRYHWRRLFYTHRQTDKLMNTVKRLACVAMPSRIVDSLSLVRRIKTVHKFCCHGNRGQGQVRMTKTGRLRKALIPTQGLFLYKPSSSHFCVQMPKVLFDTIRDHKLGLHFVLVKKNSDSGLNDCKLRYSPLINDSQFCFPLKV